MSLQLRPSHSATWIKCHASPLLSQSTFTEFYESDSAKEDTLAHWVASVILTGGESDIDTDPNVTDEMIYFAKEYANHVNSWGCEFQIESHLDLPLIANNFSGTPDCHGIDYDKKIIHIIDYKFGHLPVSPIENWQMICYASALVDIDNLNEWIVDFEIYQPRAYSLKNAFSSWLIPATQLIPYFDKLKGVASFIQDPSYIPIASVGKHCTFCKARHNCTALQEANLIAVHISTEVLPTELDIEQTGNELEQLYFAINILQTRISGLEAKLEYDLFFGNVSSKFTMEPVKQRERWKKDAEKMIIRYGELIGKSLISEQKPLTPNQCRKLGIDPDIINEYSEVPTGKYKLTPRNLAEAKALFGD